MLFGAVTSAINARIAQAGMLLLVNHNYAGLFK